MSNITVTLFGKFKIGREDRKMGEIRSRKAQELLSYLLLHRQHPQPREALSELLWQGQPADKSKKYLRQVLWLLQSTLGHIHGSFDHVLLTDIDWVQINPSANLSVDVDKFERTYNLIKDKQVHELDQADFKSIKKAVHLYNGSFLEGWYQEWCVIERERLEIMYLMLLDKLVQRCELQNDYGAGLVYGMEILRHDRAYEHAHRQMMRLYYLSGNRVQALHQFEHCVAALQSELDVGPSEETRRLYEQIRSDTYKPSHQAGKDPFAETGGSDQVLIDVLQRLTSFSDELTTIQLGIQREILVLKNALPGDE